MLPTGFTAIVTPGGDVVERTGVSEQRVVQGTIETRTGLTLAVRGGRTPMIAVALAALTVAIALDQQGRDRRRVTPPAAPSPARR